MSAARREAVVAEAITWLGTPYHHQACLKGVGADCAQMPLAVYAAVGLIPRVQVGDYSPQWFLHRSAERYLEWVERLAREITLAEVGPGDFAVWRFGRTFSHGAIITAWPRILHASAPDGCVCWADASRDADLAGRAVRFFSVFGGD
jgi:cell wall-associated NlpC family hydrolase